ncbi:MAG: Adenosylcobinamide-phosphate guanylyltransferase [Methanonatronarchaeales archaeon]|nr:Adenosylcobinamide-phosphate guanylyltransferase [Methanonatronarchaeales archaeon]
MAGGRGTRLGGREKPLLNLGGESFISRVLRAVHTSDLVEPEHICLSHNAPRTLTIFSDHPGATVTRGAGFHEDMRDLLAGSDRPLMVLPSDMPLLTPGTIDAAAEAYLLTGDPLSVMVTSHFKGRIGFETRGDPVEHSGINVLNPVETPQIEGRILIDKPGTACNVNTERDLEAARRLMNSGY